jgi:hypothetical protein
MTLEKIRNWWSFKGQIWCCKLLLLTLFIGPIAKGVPALKDYVPDDKYAIVLIAASLFLLLNIVITFFGEQRGYVGLFVLNTSNNQFLDRIRKAKSVDFAFSSTESLLINIGDVLSSTKIDCRVLLRNPLSNDERMKNKLLDYEQRWKSLSNQNSECKVQLKYTSNTVFRLIILDEKEVYLGFYKYVNNRLIGHSVPMLHVTKGTAIGDFLVDIAINRFNAYWHFASDNISERLSVL